MSVRILLLEDDPAIAGTGGTGDEEMRHLREVGHDGPAVDVATDGDLERVGRLTGLGRGEDVAHRITELFERRPLLRATQVAALAGAALVLCLNAVLLAQAFGVPIPGLE